MKRISFTGNQQCSKLKPGNSIMPIPGCQRGMTKCLLAWVRSLLAAERWAIGPGLSLFFPQTALRACAFLESRSEQRRSNMPETTRFGTATTVCQFYTLLGRNRENLQVWLRAQVVYPFDPTLLNKHQPGALFGDLYPLAKK